MHTRVVQFFFSGCYKQWQEEDEVSRDFRLKINNNNEVRKEERKEKEMQKLHLFFVSQSTSTSIKKLVIAYIHDDFQE